MSEAVLSYQVITLNMNGLISPLKDRDWQNRWKTIIQLYAVTGVSLQIQDSFCPKLEANSCYSLRWGRLYMGM